jgi:6-phosphogluconolactonase
VNWVYVSCAGDGEIGLYALRADGALEARGRFKAQAQVMPLSVSPDRRFLVAAGRSQPYAARSFAIDRGSGALSALGEGPLAESFPYITHDRSGRWLLAASYSAHLVSVNPVRPDGTVGAPAQVIPTARHAHAIITDRSNRFAFVPHLGTDQVLQFTFDEASGRLAWLGSTTTEKQPRGFAIEPAGRFLVAAGEKSDTITSYAIEPGGTLRAAGKAPTGRGSNWVEIVGFD